MPLCATQRVSGTHLSQHHRSGMFVQFFRFYMGLYNNTYPEVHVQSFPNHFFKGSRVHVSDHCDSAAVAYSTARLSHASPRSPSGTTFEISDSTLWYSKASDEAAARVIAAAETSRDEGVYTTYLLLTCASANCDLPPPFGPHSFFCCSKLPFMSVSV